MGFKIRLLLLLSLISGCASKGQLKYAAWSVNDSGRQWTNTAEDTIKQTNLYRQVPDDIMNFCPTYPKLSQIHRIQFWVGLLSAIVKHESQFNTHLTYTERFFDGHGNAVISRGLAQLSIESANQKRYSCDIKNEMELHDAKNNIECAIKILDYWVNQDQVISGKLSTHLGGARYWSVLRKGRSELEQIKVFTQSMPMCSYK